ncbi:hypothetical protein K439DRAFT_1629595 [Ramaria rubella]|nr:hypothetical protein K439DRAFT_1629595 [Ramaria rubella]
MLRPQDHIAVSGQIATLDQSLSQLQIVEDKLSGELSSIRNQIEDLRTQRAALRSRIAAIWTLPNEILGYIFEMGVVEEQEALMAGAADEENTDYERFQILVSHVCRTFREVAIHTHILWSQIHISDLHPPRLDFVRTCIARSGSSSLDITIACEETFEPNSESIQVLVALLNPQIHRFQRFTARLCGFQSLYHIMQHLNQPAPLLEVLELTDIDYENAFDEDDPFEPPALREPLTLFCGEMPKLYGVALDGAHVAWTKCNFAGLVDLHLGYHTRDVRPSYPEFKKIIDASPTLRTLELRGSAPVISDDTTESSLYPSIQMEQLDTLHISEISSDYVTTLISLLDAPQLQSLSLTDLNTNDYSAFFHKIVGPPARFPILTSLKLASIEVGDDAFEEFLRAHPKLTRLGLYFDKMPLSWLSYLEPKKSENEVLCPKLQCLRCVSAPAYEIKRILQTRQKAGFPIPVLELDKASEDFGAKDCMQWIRENAVVEIIEPSEAGSDEELDDSDSEWGTEEQDDFGGFPFFSMEGFSDEEVDEDEVEDEEVDEDEVEDEEDSDGGSEMEIDGTDNSDEGE